MGKLMHDLSLVKIRFQAHGSHRVLHGHYVYHRPTFLFREVHPPASQGVPETRAQPASAPREQQAPAKGARSP
jgi:hypothetical protein